MSLGMAVARRGNMGDPGLFGFIGDALGAVGKTALGAVGGFATGGIAGGILGATRAAVGALGGPRTVAQAKAANVLSVATRTAPFVPSIRTTSVFGSPAPRGVPLQAGSGVYVGPGGAAVGKYNMNPGAPAAPAAAGTAIATCTIKGYHLNKAGYYGSGGYVAPQSKCVRNRRRNPLNPRALSRAMSRVASAQRAVKAIKLFSGAPARAARANPKGKTRSKGRCGCR